jgi:hypothetical protein
VQNPLTPLSLAALGSESDLSDFYGLRRGFIPRRVLFIRPPFDRNFVSTAEKLSRGFCGLVCLNRQPNKSALPFLTGQFFSNTKDTTVTKEKLVKSRLFSPFVFLVPFVVRLFPVNYGRTNKSLCQPRRSHT